MKTLDEVIKGYECCKEINCVECPYANWDNTDVVRCDLINKDDDALHYLQAYKDDKNDLTALRAYWKEQQENGPLTWDELKQMEGKPVWVEYEGYAPDWEVIEYIGNTKWKCGEVVETHLSILHKENQGKSWQAYKKERR